MTNESIFEELYTNPVIMAIKNNKRRKGNGKEKK